MCEMAMRDGNSKLFYRHAISSNKNSFHLSFFDLTELISFSIQVSWEEHINMIKVHVSMWLNCVSFFLRKKVVWKTISHAWFMWKLKNVSMLKFKREIYILEHDSLTHPWSERYLIVSNKEKPLRDEDREGKKLGEDCLENLFCCQKLPLASC